LRGLPVSDMGMANMKRWFEVLRRQGNFTVNDYILIILDAIYDSTNVFSVVTLP